MFLWWKNDGGNALRFYQKICCFVHVVETFCWVINSGWTVIFSQLFEDICYRLNVSAPLPPAPNSYDETWVPSVMGLPYEVGPLVLRSVLRAESCERDPCPYKRGPSESSLTPVQGYGHKKRSATGKTALPDHAGTRISDFQPPELREVKILFFISYPVCDSLL